MLNRLLIVGALVLVTPPVLAQSTPLALCDTKLPETPAGRQLENWLAAFNGGDVAAIRRFLEENGSAGFLTPRNASSRASAFVVLRGQNGAFTPCEVTQSTSTSLEAIVHREASETWAVGSPGTELEFAL